MSEQEKREDPQYVVEDVDDLEDLLTRAGNWAERDALAPTVAAEFRQARDFVRDELADEVALADGGER